MSLRITKRPPPGQRYLTAKDIPKRRSFKRRHLGNMAKPDVRAGA